MQQSARNFETARWRNFAIAWYKTLTTVQSGSVKNGAFKERSVRSRRRVDAETYKPGASYSARLRQFALLLHYYSPRAYKFLRRECCNALPHPRTISAWYSIRDRMRTGIAYGRARTSGSSRSNERSRRGRCFRSTCDIGVRRNGDTATRRRRFFLADDTSDM